MDNNNSETDVQHLINAFKDDSFDVDPENGVFHYNGKTGIRAINQTATINGTSRKKKAFYVEGDNYEMGYLMGLMAEPEVARMCTEFNQNIFLAYINVDIKDPKLRKILGKIIEDITFLLSKNIYQDIPQTYKEELEGILDGCKHVNPDTKVTREGLWVLNVGVDAVLAFIYTGKLPHKKTFPIELKPEHFRVPYMCNGFAVSGADADNNGHFFGRDFMFPTANVFQDTACYVIQNPSNGNAFVSITAPGGIGAITGLSIKGLGVGVDMSASGNCNPNRPGFNSLLLNRYSIEHGDSCETAVQIMVDAQRGVTWNYILADGNQDKSCIVEAGEKIAQINFLSYPPKELKDDNLLPDQSFLSDYPSTEQQQGLMVRWNDFKYPTEYFQFNQNLFNKFHKPYNPEDFSKMGYIDETWTDKNCPYSYFFAPQREDLDNLVLVTNSYIIPEMRLCAMNPWTTLVSAGTLDDVQWRYDQLNNELLTAIAKGPITFDKARTIIDFLAPYGQFPNYYNPDNKPLDELQIQGCVSILDVKNKVIQSHYGYYSDEWVTIHLDNYISK